MARRRELGGISHRCDQRCRRQRADAWRRGETLARLACLVPREDLLAVRLSEVPPGERACSSEIGELSGCQPDNSRRSVSWNDLPHTVLIPQTPLTIK
jgi:hypothetical protein